LKHADEKLVEWILKNRHGVVKFKPGFDGEYGVPLFSDEEKESSGGLSKEGVSVGKAKQRKLTSF